MMRLLQLEGEDGLSLIRFLDNNIPPYAILSHTWGADDEEVTFEDLEWSSRNDSRAREKAKAKRGYDKIIFCGRQAARDDIKYFWVDTCCIKKSSDSELTEALNSMFRWYRNAAKCYVYLPDVPLAGSDTGAETWMSHFRKSRWFTRGWTLQELLAPTSVEFFSESGHKLGSRESLEGEIHEITGIPFQALRGDPLSTFSIQERMSWTEKRQTKREEDMAYSLLGIFDLHMALIYGEGRERALARLLRKARKYSDNQWATSDIYGLVCAGGMFDLPIKC
jgi:hypothetical protein